MSDLHSSALDKRLEDTELEQLKKLHKEGQLNGVFGVSRIQRLLRFSYNRAFRLIERALAGGLIRQCESRPWNYEFVGSNNK